jgi:hypothetical protein
LISRWEDIERSSTGLVHQLDRASFGDIYTLLLGGFFRENDGPISFLYGAPEVWNCPQGCGIFKHFLASGFSCSQAEIHAHPSAKTRKGQSAKATVGLFKP